MRVADAEQPFAMCKPNGQRSALEPALHDPSIGHDCTVVGGDDWRFSASTVIASVRCSSVGTTLGPSSSQAWASQFRLHSRLAVTGRLGTLLAE